MYCENCKVDVLTDTGICPLCHEQLTPSTESIYPPRPRMIKKSTLSLFTKIYWFIALIAYVTVIYIDYTLSNKLTWSIIVAVGLLYAYVLIRNTIIAKSNVALKLLIQALCACILIFTIDYETGTNDTFWSLNYAIPFVVASTTIASSLVAVFNLKRWRDYLSYLLVNIMISVIPLVLAISLQIDVQWPSRVSCGFSAFVLIGMVIFYKQKLGNELKKKFHL